MLVAISVLYEPKNKNISTHLLGKLELFYFNIAMHDAIKIPYVNIFENIFDLGSHRGII